MPNKLGCPGTLDTLYWQLGRGSAALGRAGGRMRRHVVGLGWLGAAFMRAWRAGHDGVGGMARGSGWAERARWTLAEARMALM